MTEQEPAELDVDKIASFWLTEAEEALEVAGHLIAKADYSYALFFGHLAVEKMLKALFVTRQKQLRRQHTTFYDWPALLV